MGIFLSPSFWPNDKLPFSVLVYFMLFSLNTGKWLDLRLTFMVGIPVILVYELSNMRLSYQIKLVFSITN